MAQVAPRAPQAVEPVPRAQRQKVYKTLELLRQLAELSARVEAVVFESRHVCGCKANQHQAVPRDLPEDVRRAFEDEKSRRMEDAITKTALSVVKTVMSHKYAFVFNQPVDTETYKDYLTIVKQPMDLGTIKDRLEGGKHYKDEKEIWSDIALVFTNAMLYNPPGSDVNIMAQTVHEAAEERWEKDISSKIAAEQAWAVREEATRRKTYAETLAKLDANAMQQQALQLLAIMEELVSSIQDVKNAAAAACESLTYEEAEELGAALKKLTPAQLQAAVQVVAARQPAALQLSQMQAPPELGSTPARRLVVNISEFDPVSQRQLQILVAKAAAAREQPQPQGTAAAEQAADRAQPGVAAAVASLAQAQPPAPPAEAGVSAAAATAAAKPIAAQQEQQQPAAAGVTAVQAAPAAAARTPGDVDMEAASGGTAAAAADPVSAGTAAAADSAAAAAAGVKDSAAELQQAAAPGPAQPEQAAAPASEQPAQAADKDTQPAPMETDDPAPATQAAQPPASTAAPSQPQPPTQLVLPQDLQPAPGHSAGPPAAMAISPFASASSQGTGAAGAAGCADDRGAGAAMVATPSIQGPATDQRRDSMQIDGLPGADGSLQPLNIPATINGLTVIQDFLGSFGLLPEPSPPPVGAALGAPWPGLPLGAGVRPGPRVQVRTGEQQRIQEAWENGRRAEAYRVNQASQQQQRQRKQSLASASSMRQRSLAQPGQQQSMYDVPPPPPPPPPIMTSAGSGGLVSFPAPPLQPPPPPSAFQAGAPGLLSPYPSAPNAVTPAKIGLKRKGTSNANGWSGTLETMGSGARHGSNSLHGDGLGGEHGPGEMGGGSASKAHKPHGCSSPNDPHHSSYPTPTQHVLPPRKSLHVSVGHEVTGAGTGEFKLITVPSAAVPPGANVTATSPGSAPPIQPGAAAQVLNLSARPPGPTPGIEAVPVPVAGPNGIKSVAVPPACTTAALPTMAVPPAATVVPPAEPKPQMAVQPVPPAVPPVVPAVTVGPAGTPPLPKRLSTELAATPKAASAGTTPAAAAAPAAAAPSPSPAPTAPLVSVASVGGSQQSGGGGHAVAAPTTSQGASSAAQSAAQLMPLPALSTSQAAITPASVAAALQSGGLLRATQQGSNAPQFQQVTPITFNPMLANVVQQILQQQQQQQQAGGQGRGSGGQVVVPPAIAATPGGATSSGQQSQGTPGGAKPVVLPVFQIRPPPVVAPSQPSGLTRQPSLELPGPPASGQLPGNLPLPMMLLPPPAGAVRPQGSGGHPAPSGAQLLALQSLGSLSALPGFGQQPGGGLPLPGLAQQPGGGLPLPGLMPRLSNPGLPPPAPLSVPPAQPAAQITPNPATMLLFLQQLKTQGTNIPDNVIAEVLRRQAENAAAAQGSAGGAQQGDDKAGAPK